MRIQWRVRASGWWVWSGWDGGYLGVVIGGGGLRGDRIWMVQPTTAKAHSQRERTP